MSCQHRLAVGAGVVAARADGLVLERGDRMALTLSIERVVDALLLTE